MQVWWLYTQHLRPAVTHGRISIPDVDPLLEAPFMDLLVNGHNHIVCDPSFLDVLHGKEAEASAAWMFCRAVCCRARWARHILDGLQGRAARHQLARLTGLVSC